MMAVKQQASQAAARRLTPGAEGSRARLSWSEEKETWPNSDTASIVQSGATSWLVQRSGTGPSVLMLHGTGASSHSWRGLTAGLSPHFEVIAPDLPGHGFSDPLPGWRATLPQMADAIGGLLDTLKCNPHIVIGHSAGAAILLRLALDGVISPRLIVSVNGALLPFTGLARYVFSPMARLLAVNPLTSRAFSWRLGDRSAVERLLGDTGSHLSSENVALYARLAKSPAHISGALAMMAGWNLDPLVADLPKLQCPLLLICGSRDRAVPPDDAWTVRRLVPEARVIMLKGLGHLAHEESPDEVVDSILEAARNIGLSAS